MNNYLHLTEILHSLIVPGGLAYKVLWMKLIAFKYQSIRLYLSRLFFCKSYFPGEPVIPSHWSGDRELPQWWSWIHAWNGGLEIQAQITRADHSSLCSWIWACAKESLFLPHTPILAWVQGLVDILILVKEHGYTPDCTRRVFLAYTAVQEPP